MISSFSTALSALNATSTAIDVVGNNLANLNTTGFKTSVVSFHDLVSQSMGTLGETQVGFGVGRPVTFREFSQGAIQTTSGPLDAAIQGDGFFIVKDSSGATQYTRGGNMQVDKQGNLITSTGEKLQGWTTLNASGTLDSNSPVGDIVVPTGTVRPAVATQNVSLDMNLNAGGASGDQFSRTLAIYDSLGNSHLLNMTFTKGTTPNDWSYSIDVPAGDLKSAMTPVTGKLTFDSSGKLTSPAATDTPQEIDVAGLTDGAADMKVSWNAWNNGSPRITQYAQSSAVSANSQDGSPPANLLHAGLSDGGKVVAQYSNGDQIVVGQLALAVVQNPESLMSVGNNDYALSARTSLPAIGLPDTGGRGSILGGAVEASTVDIAKEFTNLIVLQRAYQANAKVVTTVDQLSQDTISLKQ